MIPCFNESAGIAGIVSGVRRHLPNVVVVDDGSTDGTAEHAARAGAEVVPLSGNTGKGVALRAGWQRARDRGFAWALTLDGDGQHATDDIPAFLNCVEKTGAPLVVGNRMGHAEKMPWLRRQVNRWMSRRISNLAGTPLADSQCGFRLMQLDAWSRLPLRASHFEIESEVLLAFARAGLAIEFVPVQVIYRAERSKIRPWRDTVRWFRWWHQARKKTAARQ